MCNLDKWYVQTVCYDDGKQSGWLERECADGLKAYNLL